MDFSAPPGHLSAILRDALGTSSGLDQAGFAATDWPSLESELGRHGLTAVGYEVLERQHVRIPPQTRERMGLQHRSDLRRRRVIGELLDDVAAAFAAARTPVVLLAGTNLLRVLHGEGAPAIPQAVEMLVAEPDRSAAEQRLRDIGFCEETRRDPNCVSFSPGLRAWVPFVLTSRLLDPPRGLFDADCVRDGARPADRSPGVLRIMSPEHELIYLCLLVDGASRRMSADSSPKPPIPWRELYDLGASLHHIGSRTDWTRFVVEAGGRGVADAVASSLASCAQLLSLTVPSEVVDGLEQDPASLSRASRHSEISEGGRSSLFTTGDFRPQVAVSYVTAKELVHPDRWPGLRLERTGEDLVSVSRAGATLSTDSRLRPAVILQWCDGKHSREEITEIAACLFGVDPVDIAAEVHRILETSAQKGWVRPQGTSILEKRLSFPIVDRHGRWADRLSNRYCTSRYVDWRLLRQPEDQGESNDVLSFTQFDLEDAHLYRARRKIAWMREPRPIAWWTYDSLEHHIDELDTVLTYETELIDRYPEKCIYCPGGGSHIHPADFRMHPKSKLVSFIASAKRFRAPGHLARHEFWELIKPGRPILTRQMLNGREVDCYGPLVGKPIEDKLDSLKDYMFQIAVENIICDTYFTEKLIDCFLTGTIPIYRGSHRVGEFFDAEGILFYATSEELFAILRRLTPEEYQRRLPHALRNFELAQRYTHAVDWVYEHTGVFRACRP